MPTHYFRLWTLAVALGAAAAHGQSVTVLHGFAAATDGAQPASGVIVLANGHLAGTATKGGSANAGTVFEMVPPGPKRTAWTFRAVHQFGGKGDGGTPVGALTLAPSGVVYGTTKYGGDRSDGSGTVFQLTPPVPPRRVWTKVKLYNFLGEKQETGNNSVDGAWPVGKVYVDGAGNLFGSAIDGGNPNFGTGITSDGAWWQLTPPAAGQTAWTETLTGYPGQAPMGGLIGDGTGRVYGTSEYGNLLNAMLFFIIGNPSWTVEGGYNRNGVTPSDPVLGSDGALYATDDAGPGGNGLVLQLPVSADGSTPGKIVQIYSFAGGADGANPAGPLVAGPAGSFYGTTSQGGANGLGTIYQISPPASGTVWTHTVLYSFDSTASGPSGPLTPGAGGVFYGTTMSGGSGAAGTVYQFTP